MRRYVLVQPEQEPPINPGEKPVPMTGLGILLIIGGLVGLYFLWWRDRHKINKQ